MVLIAGDTVESEIPSEIPETSKNEKYVDVVKGNNIYISTRNYWMMIKIHVVLQYFSLIGLIEIQVIL